MRSIERDGNVGYDENDRSAMVLVNGTAGSRGRMVYSFSSFLCVLGLLALPEQKFCQRYDQLMEVWEKKIERIENNPRRRAKENKVREYYERQFPEIRKQRELQERMQ
eukprot:g19081.t1